MWASPARISCSTSRSTLAVHARKCMYLETMRDASDCNKLCKPVSVFVFVKEKRKDDFKYIYTADTL